MALNKQTWGKVNSGQLLLRLAALVIVASMVQIVGFSQITVFGGTADITPLIVASVGLLGGSVIGAVTGFSLGLVLDFALLQTLGVSSLVYVGVGYVAGRLFELRSSNNALVVLATGVAATVFSIVGFALMQFLLGVTLSVNFLVIRELLITLLLNAILILPIYLIVQLVLGSTLQDRIDRPTGKYPDHVLNPLSSSR